MIKKLGLICCIAILCSLYVASALCAKDKGETGKTTSQKSYTYE